MKQNITNISDPKVMGILNLTPDSFYDGGQYLEQEDLHLRIRQLVEEGADIIDVGAYSTRPGAEKVSLEEEWNRLVPALTFLRKNYPEIQLSVDTFRREIADRVRRYFGRFIVNDISGGPLDEGLFRWVAEYKMPYVLMHIQGTPQTMQQHIHYTDVVTDVYNFLEERLRELRSLGAEEIIIDLGFGFGKTLEHNYRLLREIPRFESLGCPMLVGVSRKSMIYKALSITPNESLNGTTALNAFALQNGAKILRVHDVKQAKETIKLFERLQNS